MKRVALPALLVAVLLAMIAGTALASPPPSPGPGSHNACNGLHQAEASVANPTAFGHLVVNDLALCHGIG